MPSCAVSTCTNTDRKLDLGFSFHHFPRDKKRSKLWKEKCKRKDNFSTSIAVICSDHFNSSCFVVDKVNRLLGLNERTILAVDAVPTVNMPLQFVKNVDSSRGERLMNRNIVQGNILITKYNVFKEHPAIVIYHL
jgi:THAP domain